MFQVLQALHILSPHHTTMFCVNLLSSVKSTGCQWRMGQSWCSGKWQMSSKVLNCKHNPATCQHQVLIPSSYSLLLTFWGDTCTSVASWRLFSKALEVSSKSSALPVFFQCAILDELHYCVGCRLWFMLPLEWNHPCVCLGKSMRKKINQSNITERQMLACSIWF